MTTDAFWNAARDHRLVIQWCTVGRHPIWYPRELCPTHPSSDLEWRPATGAGTVYAFTVDHRADPPLATALIDLEEGVRLMANIVDVPTTSITVGMPVVVTWVESGGEGRTLPQFTAAP